MSLHIDFTVVYALDGSPVRVHACWKAPDGEWRHISEEMPPSADELEVESVIRFIRTALNNDPF